MRVEKVWTDEQQEALTRHGYTLNMGIYGLKNSGPHPWLFREGRCHVCYLDGVEIDGHGSSDLCFPVCIYCNYNPEDSGGEWDYLAKARARGDDLSQAFRAGWEAAMKEGRP